jgi:multicomponent K+:H+ antiporter subunit F
MNTMLEASVWFAQLCFAVAMVNAMIAIMRGPTAQDRVLAFDTLYINGMLTLLLFGVRWSSSVHFEVAMLIALFGFVGTASLAMFLYRGEVIEP